MFQPHAQQIETAIVRDWEMGLFRCFIPSAFCSLTIHSPRVIFRKAFAAGASHIWFQVEYNKLNSTFDFGIGLGAAA